MKIHCMVKKPRQEQGYLFGSGPMPTMEEIIAGLRRAPRGVSKDIAAELGVPAQTVSNWRRGFRAPYYDNALRLIDALRNRGLME